MARVTKERRTYSGAPPAFIGFPPARGERSEEGSLALRSARLTLFCVSRLRCFDEEAGVAAATPSVSRAFASTANSGRANSRASSHFWGRRLLSSTSLSTSSHAASKFDALT